MTEDVASDWAAQIVGSCAELVAALVPVREGSKLGDAGLRVLEAAIEHLGFEEAPPPKLTSFKGGKDKGAPPL